MENLFTKGNRIREISEELNLSWHSIYNFLHRKGYDLARENKIKSNAKTIKKLYNNGVSIKEISELVGVNYNYVSSSLYSYVDSNRRNTIELESKLLIEQGLKRI